MEIFVVLLGIMFFLSILAAVIFFGIFMARKAGILPEKGAIIQSEEGGISGSGWFDIHQLKESLLFRFGIVAVLTLLMAAPLDMVNSIVTERHQLYNSVLGDIARTWGQTQKVSGPALLIPYTEKHIQTETVQDKDGNERKVNKTVFKARTAIVLPNEVKINAKLDEERRQRSIYESLVYQADMKLEGVFPRPDIEGISTYIETVHWDKAWLMLGITDTQAIKQASALQWNGKAIDFEPGTRITKLIKNGFHAPLILDAESKEFRFTLNLIANGSGGFYFKPFGKTTDVNVSANWPHPSFQGSVLPQKHNITDAGFDAQWHIPHLARNYPQLWTLENQAFDVHEFEAGVRLFEPVSLYSQITRAIKYGILFIVLTYITFLIFELGIKRRLHWVQYGIIGLALSIFYLALLSLSEHIRFFPAYLASAGIIITMISAYVYASIRSFSRVAIVALLLVGLYSILYSLLKLEDYALLVGTLLLLVILGVMMYLTRHTGSSDNSVDNI